MQLKTKKQTRNASVFDLLFFMHVSVLFYVSDEKKIDKKIILKKNTHYNGCIAQQDTL